MEEYIAETKRICTNYFGEQGLGEKIGNNIRDGMICETVERIQDDSSSTAFICFALYHHLLYEQVCCAALKKLVELVEADEQEQPQARGAVCIEILDSSTDAGLFLDAMENHTNIPLIQVYGAKILAKLIPNADYFSNGYRHRERTIQAFLSALVQFAEKEQVQETLFRVIKKLHSEDYVLFREIDYAQVAVMIPLCFEALRRYPANLYIVYGAFFFLFIFQGFESVAAFVGENPDAQDIVRNAIENL